MIPIKTIEELILKHSTLEKDLSSGDLEKKVFAEKSKEYFDISEVIVSAKKYLSYEKDKFISLFGSKNGKKSPNGLSTITSKVFEISVLIFFV